MSPKKKSNLNYSAIFYSLKIHVFLLNKADYTFYQKKKKKEGSRLCISWMLFYPSQYALDYLLLHHLLAIWSWCWWWLRGTGFGNSKDCKKLPESMFFTSIYFFSNVDFPFLSQKLSFFYYICFLCVTISLFGCKETRWKLT